jgi:KipI family sensor histidine kinase inhibitor
LLVRFDPLKTNYEKLVFQAEEIKTKHEEQIKNVKGKGIVIPVAYGGEYGPDIGDVAEYHGLTEDRVIELHSQREYRVYMIGFVAGFPYLGEVAEKIATPRLATPRLKVPEGSVGIAEKQTGIYPREAPGGWRIIGRTPISLFDPEQQPPSLLKAGDTVKFKIITEQEFEALSKTKTKQAPKAQPIGRKVFRVLKPGFLTTVQDLGRHGFLRYGVPVSGAMDTFSLTAANLLVGNQPNEACLEITLIGPELRVLAPTQIAVTGGELSPKINGHNTQMWQTLSVHKNDVIAFGKMESGCRAYLAVRGGIAVPHLLGSRSTYIRGGFGGINGRPLEAGDIVATAETDPMEKELYTPRELVPRFTSNVKVHVVLGPQADMFTENGMQTFLTNSYKVTSEADRMGYRLEGPAIEHKEKAEIVSDALLPGAVQVPGNGTPIIIMRDAQTTGGYPKIAAIISADVNALGQARPNSTVEFCSITMKQARDKVNNYLKILATLNRMFKEKS